MSFNSSKHRWAESAPHRLQPTPCRILTRPSAPGSWAVLKSCTYFSSALRLTTCNAGQRGWLHKHLWIIRNRDSR